MSNQQSTTAVCPCGTVLFPQVICNLPDLPAIAYRIGDFNAFRYRLLQTLPDETELIVWRPGAEGDLAVQMMEWWAYVGDILTFYNERIANESYLRTALLPESVNHLVQLLGYRPKPALGARATLAALLTPSARPPLTLPAGLQIQSKPGPGQRPQIFELDKPASVTAPDVISTVVNVTSPPLLVNGSALPLGGSAWLWLAGKVSGIKAADRLLLINAKALTSQTIADYAWIKVSGTAAQSDPLGNPVTQVTFSAIAGSIPGGALASDYVLLRSSQSSPLWGYPNSPPAISSMSVDLAGIARGVTAGSMLLLDVADGAAAAAVTAATAAAAALKAAATAAQAAALQVTSLTALEAAAIAAAAPQAAALAAAAAGLVSAASGNPILLAEAVLMSAEAADVSLAAAAALTTAAASAAKATNASIGLVPTPVIVQRYAEVVWYANGQGPSPPQSNQSNPVPAVAIPHAEIGFTNSSLSDYWWQFAAAQITARWSWTPVGQVVPALTAADLTYTGGNTALVPAPGAASFPTLPASVLLEDPAGNAAAAIATAAASPADGATLGNIAPPPPPPLSLASPMNMLFNLFGVSRGKTVPSETLGSGNPSVAGQDFTLVKSPVTYFFDPASGSGNNFSSTVKVSVNGVQWREVQSFYGQPQNAQVFVLREDDQQNTHVTFGDGVNGALLPTGSNNVVATYRYGAGAAAPDAETLTVVLTPTPGLKGVRNPLPPTGGNDADQPSQLRTLAPQSVLTFNRAVSLDDYAAIALTASGVTQAVASFAFDPQAQRPVVTLWIAGDAGAAAAAAAAIAGTAVPNQGLRIYQATAVATTLSLTYVRDTRYADAAIQAGLTTALVDPDAGLLGTNVAGIGQTIYQSQIAAACLAVPGVTAIQDVVLATVDGIKFRPLQFNFVRRVIRPVTPANCSGQSYSPGAGKYFSLPNDGQHLFLSGVTAS